MKRIRRFMNQLLLLLGSSVFLLPDSISQCVIDTSVFIEPIDTVNINLEIEGLLNDDMSDPAQGICGIRLAFEHEYLGDIYIELISPSGQTVRLIGPEVTSGFTNLSRWNVLFVPCGFPTAPDPGFSSQWDNDQAWGILNSYTGTYHPFSGCLEDFNIGPANGTWTIRIVDRSQFYGGEITSITLIFCDPSGLDCNPCNANAGTWVNEGVERLYCRGDQDLLLDTSLQYMGSRPDSSIYAYTWTVSTPDTIEQYLDVPDLRSFLPGSYTVCGLSYRKDEIALLPDALDSMHIDSLKNRLNSGSAPFCGQLTNGCMKVDIIGPPDTVDIYGNICSGGIFVWRLDTFSLPGTYLINKPFIGNCDSVFRINIELLELQARITGPDTLDCGNPSILLDGSQSDTISQTNFSWSLDGLVIDPGQMESNVIVDRGGLLQLIISANGCADTASVFIHIDTVKPIVNLILDTLGCQKDSVWIRSVHSGAIINYNWSGPGLEEQYQDSALITALGNYSYTVEGSNGCDTTVNFEIIEDYRFPDFELSLDTLTCNSDTIIPNIINRIPGTSFNWAGPQGFIFNGIDPKITLAGIYTLSAISPSGCRSDTSLMVFADFQEPRFSLIEDTLSCQPDSIQLEVSPYDPTLLYQWTGPSGFFSTEGLPFVRIEGQYILTVTGKNGCIAIDTVLISKTDAVPDIEYETVNIDCLNSTGSIRAQSPTGIFYSWQGPNGFSSSESEISGLEAGVYYLTVSDASGCENTRIIEIKESTDPPEVTLSGDTINCDSPIVTLSFVSADSIASFFWVAPDNSTYRDSSLSVSLPGQYIFLGRGSNGCVVEDTIIIEIDTLTPLGQILPVNITCENDSVWLKLNDYSMAQVVKWLFPNNVEIFLDSVPTRSGGEYIVQLTGSNGCISQDTLFVNVDTIPPILVTAAGEINCNSRQTEITVQPNSDVRSWTISGPAGTVSDQLTWSIREPGDYTVQWVGVNGCQLTDTITVVADTLVPDVMPFHENFDCRKKDTIVIGASSSLPNTEFLWTGPGGFTSSKKDTFVSLPGVYQLRTIGINGCVRVDSVTIIYDTIPPTWSYYPVDTLSCANDSIDLIVRTDSEMASIAFDAPEGRLVNDSTWRTGQPGWILTLVEGENACVNIDSIEIQIDTIQPQMFLTGGSLTCDELRVRINAQVGPAGGVIQWSGPGNFNTNQYDPLVASPGWYIAEYELDNGCIVTDSVLVTSEIDPPEVIINDGILPCDGNSITLVVSSDTSGVEFNWTGPGGFRFNGPEPEVNLTGQYIVIVTGSNGCQTIDTIIVDQASNNTSFDLIADTINCIDPTFRIDANSDKDSLTFSWQGPGGFSGNGQQIDISLGGWYFISATDSLGCQAIDSIYVETDTSVARINIQSEAPLGCNNDTTKLVALFQGDISNSEWYWLDSSGNPFGIGQDSVTVTRPGEYLIVLENKANGCQRRDTIVVATSNGGLDVMVDGVDPTCPGRSDGILMITSILGNTGPWEVIVNGNAEGSEAQISGLPPGDYRISLEDSAGCTWDSTITLMRPDTLWVQLGPDRTIDLGSSVNLDPLVNPGASGVRVISWEPEDPLCPLCLTRQVTPNSSTRYSLTIEDDRGCSAMDDVLITIRSRTGIFLPNAFTPNDDGVNDSWIISVNEGITRINSLQIYDRWGNMVHSLTGIQVTDGLSLWDGTANGKELNPGVFVYSLTYETTNGTKAHLSGDITLIR